VTRLATAVLGLSGDFYTQERGEESVDGNQKNWNLFKYNVLLSI